MATDTDKPAYTTDNDIDSARTSFTGNKTGEQISNKAGDKSSAKTYGKESPAKTTADLKQAGDELKHAGEEIGHEVKQEARQQAEQSKKKAADKIDDAADVVDHLADTLSEEDMESLSAYAHSASRMLSGFADDISNKSVDELSQQIRQYARRQPGILLAGSVALGFGLTRFFKASSHRPHTADDTDTLGDQQTRSMRQNEDTTTARGPSVSSQSF